MINPTKFGDCSQCPKKRTNVVKVCKELLCVQCNTNRKAIQSLDRAEQRNALQRGVKLEKPNKDLIKDLDDLFSRYVRLSAMDENKECECYTCSNKQHWTLMQCGHFISRSHKGLRWLLKNLKVQCFTCNVEKRGNLIVYAERLNLEEPGLSEWLTDQSRDIVKPTTSDLKELLIDIKAKLKLVERKLI